MKIIDRINELANRRHELYRTAGKASLSEDELRELTWIDGELARLWDLRRAGEADLPDVPAWLQRIRGC